MHEPMRRGVYYEERKLYETVEDNRGLIRIKTKIWVSREVYERRGGTGSFVRITRYASTILYKNKMY